MSENGRARCNGTTKADEPCKSPERLVGEDGYCAMHRPGNEDRAKLIGQLGAEATKRRWLGKNLSADELPALESPGDVKVWAHEVAAAVPTGRRAGEPELPPRPLHHQTFPRSDPAVGWSGASWNQTPPSGGRWPVGLPGAGMTCRRS